MLFMLCLPAGDTATPVTSYNKESRRLNVKHFEFIAGVISGIKAEQDVLAPEDSLYTHVAEEIQN